MISFLHINSYLNQNTLCISNVFKEIKKIESYNIKPLYQADILFDEDLLTNFLEQSKNNKIKSYISVDIGITNDLLFEPAVDENNCGIMLKDNLILPSLVNNDFQYFYRDFIARLLSTIAPYKNFIECIIPELPYPFFPLFTDKLIDYNAIALFSKFIKNRYNKKSENIKNIYSEFFENGKIPRGQFPPGKSRLIFLNDLTLFVYYYFENFYASVFNVDNLLIFKPTIIPELELGYKINNISNGLLDIKPEINGLANGVFDFIKLTKLVAENNVAGGLFLKDGSIPKESKNDFISLIKKIAPKSDACFFIPIEYLKSSSKIIKHSGIFTDKVPSSYPDLANIYDKWKKITTKELCFSFNGSIFDSFNFIFVFTAEWINPIWEKRILEACSKGASIFLISSVPKYDLQGCFSGIIMEKILQLQDIVFGHEKYVKMYKIGCGKLIIFSDDKIEEKDIPKMKALYKTVCDL